MGVECEGSVLPPDILEALEKTDLSPEIVLAK
jgi:hypothetical protein